MTARTKPPFRADHVGSFLRPKYLLDAREQFFTKKEITAEQLRLVEDRAITEIVFVPSTHAAAGNDGPVAEVLLSEMNLDAVFLAYAVQARRDKLRLVPETAQQVWG